jgi:competence CoiA-like predicted nuclease
MLMAKTKNGKMFCLGNPYKKEMLLSLRQREEFFCPVCGEKVILKLGDRKIYHFSHLSGGNCRDFYENETEYHMEGKLELYQWLKKQNIPAVLEFYDREIQQRPDILFHYNSQKYALEFQCSTISEDLFKKRTDNYLTHGYTPLWIIGGDRLKEMYHDSAGITGFQYLFLRKTRDGQLFIPSFSPDYQSFTFLYSIFPYSTKNALLKKFVRPAEKLKLSTFLEPLLVPSLNRKRWVESCDQYKLHWSLYPGSKQKEFLTEVYNHHLNLFLFPAEIGLPVTHGMLIQTPPFMWQAYYYMDILHNKRPGDNISNQQIQLSFRKRVMANQMILRSFPQITRLNPLLAYIEYTQLLERLGVLAKKTPYVYEVQKTLVIPQNNREKEEQTICFFKQNPQIFEKNETN